MIRRSEQCLTTTEHCAKGGAGDFLCTELLKKNSAEFYGKGRMLSACVLPPKASVGLHTHIDEFEVCYFLEGTGSVFSDNRWQSVSAGDVAIAWPGEAHAVNNDSDVPLRYIALILYS